MRRCSLLSLGADVSLDQEDSFLDFHYRRLSLCASLPLCFLLNFLFLSLSLLLSAFKSEVSQQQASEGRENPADMPDSSHINSKDKRDTNEGGGAPSNSAERRGDERQPQQQDDEDEDEEEGEAVVVSISSSGEVKKKRSKRRTGGNGEEGERGSRRGENAAREGGDNQTDGDENLSFEEKYRKYSHRPSATEAVQAVQVRQEKGSLFLFPSTIFTDI